MGSEEIFSICYNLPLSEGQKGHWQITKFKVSRSEALCFNAGQYINNQRRFIQPGEYWRLTYKDEIIMSNTPAEIFDHVPFIKKAEGDILVAGLGLGMVLQVLSNKESITSITVIEKSKDIIDLISPYFDDTKIRIIHDDIFTWTPDRKFQYGWFDIWTYIEAKNYEEMEVLNNKYKSFVRYKSSWCRKECRKKYLEER